MNQIFWIQYLWYGRKMLKPFGELPSLERNKIKE